MAKTTKKSKRKKIALLTSCDVAHSVGGVQVHVQNLARHLAQRGHHVSVCSPMTDFDDAVRAWAADGIELLPLQHLNLKLYINQSDARVNFDLIGMLQLMQKFRTENYDVVHIHEPIQPAFGMVSVLYSPIATVATWHSYVGKVRLADWPIWGYSLLTRPGFGFFKNWAGEQLNVKIAVSHAAEETAQRFIPGDYVIVPNGVDYDEFQARQPKPPEYEDGKFNVLFVGRLSSSRKGISTLLRAYSLIKDRYPNLRVVAVGPGDLERHARRVAAERCLDDVIYVGECDRERLIGYYQHADVFCAPNTGRESFGMILIEAMAAGTPVVASRLRSFVEVGGDDQFVRFFDVDDEFALAENLEQLYLNPAECQKMREKGRAYAKKFAWQQVTSMVEEQYEIAIERYEQSPKYIANMKHV